MSLKCHCANYGLLICSGFRVNCINMLLLLIGICLSALRAETFRTSFEDSTRDTQSCDPNKKIIYDWRS